MPANLDTPRLREIRAALTIDTTNMGRYELAEVWKLTDQLTSRLTCELWGDKMGWDIPPYLSPEWMEMQRAWMESEDEE